jgi:hypothetical protein
MVSPVTVLWCTEERKCVLVRHDAEHARLEIVVQERGEPLRREFFSDDRQAAQFAIDQMHAANNPHVEI